MGAGGADLQVVHELPELFEGGAGEDGRDVGGGHLHVLPGHQRRHAPEDVRDAFPLVVGALEGMGLADPLLELPGPYRERVHLGRDLEGLRLVLLDRAAEVFGGTGEGADREQEARIR